MVTEGVGRFGVVCTLKSNHPDEHFIALRANMDALQLTEPTNLPSRNYACLRTYCNVTWCSKIVN